MLNTTVLVIGGMTVVGLLGLGFRTWLKAFIERAVVAKFDREIEAVRSDLRLKEAKITALQSNVLGGKAARHAALDNKRLEALEDLWRHTVKLDQFQWAAKQVTVFKLDELNKEAVRQPRLREMLSTLAGGSDLADLKTKLADVATSQNGRLFVPDFVWKVFDAYKAVLIYCYVRLQAIATGISDTEKLLSGEQMVAAVKSVMPHLSDYLDKHGVTGAAFAVEPLRELLFQSIVAAINGEETDEKNLSDVVRMIEQLDQTFAKSRASVS